MLKKRKKVPGKRKKGTTPSKKGKSSKGISSKRFSRKELKMYRNKLVEKKLDILSQISHIKKENLRESLKEASGDLSGYSLHMADMATDLYEREFNLSIADSEREILYRIDDALQRIEEGKYGSCIICSRNIKKQRLKAVPYARYCIACQEIEDKKTRKNLNE